MAEKGLGHLMALPPASCGTFRQVLNTRVLPCAHQEDRKLALTSQAAVRSHWIRTCPAPSTGPRHALWLSTSASDDDNDMGLHRLRRSRGWGPLRASAKAECSPGNAQSRLEKSPPTLRDSAWLLFSVAPAADRKGQPQRTRARAGERRKQRRRSLGLGEADWGSLRMGRSQESTITGFQT